MNRNKKQEPPVVRKTLHISSSKALPPKDEKSRNVVPVFKSNPSGSQKNIATLKKPKVKTYELLSPTGRGRNQKTSPKVVQLNMSDGSTNVRDSGTTKEVSTGLQSLVKYSAEIRKHKDSSTNDEGKYL